MNLKILRKKTAQQMNWIWKYSSFCFVPSLQIFQQLDNKYDYPFAAHLERKSSNWIESVEWFYCRPWSSIKFKAKSRSAFFKTESKENKIKLDRHENENMWTNPMSHCFENQNNNQHIWMISSAKFFRICHTIS